MYDFFLNLELIDIDKKGFFYQYQREHLIQFFDKIQTLLSFVSYRSNTRPKVS